MMTRTARQCRIGLAFVVLASTQTALAGCSDEGDADAGSLAKLLDPKREHYGKSYAEWSTEWLDYWYRFAPPTCADPVADTTGEFCDDAQDPDSDVFFLSGTSGGVAMRRCTVPAGKALFLPLVNVSGDNAGVPDDLRRTEDEMRDMVDETFDSIVPKHLWLEVDGEEVEGLERGAVEPVRYELVIPPGENAYTCVGVDGVEGTFPGYVAGYWAMLPPLPKGEHTVAFGAETGVFTGDPTLASFRLDVTYELTIE